MRHSLPQNCPETHPCRLGERPGLLYLGRAGHLTQRLEALKLVQEAKVPNQQFPDFQDVDERAPHYVKGLSKRAVR